MVSIPVIYVNMWTTTRMPTTEEWKAELLWLTDS